MPNHSFPPLRDWNELPIEVRNSPTLYTFNEHMKTHFMQPRKIPWYGVEDRECDIHHARMRLGCSTC